MFIDEIENPRNGSACLMQKITFHCWSKITYFVSIIMTQVMLQT